MKGLFRGFCRDENSEGTIVLNGEEIKGYWLVGSLVHTIYETYDGKTEDSYRIREEIIGLDENDISYYHCGYDDKVIPKTICEAVRGAKDKNGKQIYEGDVLKTPYGIGYVDYTDGSYFVELVRDIDTFLADACTRVLLYFDAESHVCAEVIGTIFDKEKV